MRLTEGADQAGLGLLAGGRRHEHRLQRAQANLFETLPLFAAAVLATHMGGQTGELTLWGSMLYLGARVLYVPLFAAGVPLVRSLAWVASIVGLVMVLAALLA